MNRDLPHNNLRGMSPRNQKQKPNNKMSTKAKTPAAKKPTPKVEKVTQNGITIPKDGSTMKLAWDAIDALSAKKKSPALRNESLEACDTLNIKRGTSAIVYGRWRKFYGLTGRLKDPAVEAIKEKAAAAKAADKKAAATKKAADKKVADKKKADAVKAKAKIKAAKKPAVKPKATAKK